MGAALDWANAASGPITAVIGGLFGNHAQKSANKTNIKLQEMANLNNLQIANQTNTMNRNIARETNAANYRLWKEQAEYNSMASQVARAQAAGFSPTAIMDTSGFNAVQSGANPTQVPGNPMVAAHMDAARVMPVDALAGQIGGLSTSLAQNTLALAQANKAQKEAAGQDLRNQTYLEEWKRNMELTGLKVDYQKLENWLKEQSNPVQLQQMYKQLEFTEQQIKDLELTVAIRKYYKENIQPEELNQIKANIDLLKEKKNTELTTQDLNRALGVSHLRSSAANMLMAQVRQYLAPSEREYNEAAAQNQRDTADLNFAQGETVMFDYRMKKIFAAPQAFATLMNAVKDARLKGSQLEVNKQLARKIAAEAGLSEKENDIFFTQKAIQNVATLMDAFQKMSQGFRR